jgi:dipeptidyl aminopeptidase/acylaminoacyl peptidase
MELHAMPIRRLLLCMLVLVSGLRGAQQPEASTAIESALRARLAEPMRAFDLDLVMLGEDFFGMEPQPLHFSSDSQRLWFRWKRWNELRAGVYECRVADGSLRRLTSDESPEEAGQWSPDHTGHVVVRDGWVEWTHAGTKRRVLRAAESVSGLVFAPRGDALIFRMGKGIWRASSEALEQLCLVGEGPRKTELTPKASPAEPEPPKTLAEWHQRHERALFRVLFERWQREEDDKRERAARAAVPTGVYRYEPPQGWQLDRLVASPSGEHALALLTRPAPAGRNVEMPDYLTLDGYTALRTVRGKVGEQEGERSAEIVDFAARTVRNIEVPQGGFGVDDGTFSPSGKTLWLSLSTHDDGAAMLAAVDPADARLEVIHEVKDKAWVLTRHLLPRWISVEHGVLISEQSGWMHLVRVEADGRGTRALTEGRFEVSEWQATPEGTTLWCVATPRTPHERDLVRVDAQSGDMTLASSGGGWRKILLSPDGRTLAEVFSKPNQPWELRLVDLATGERRTLTDSPSPAFRGFSWQSPPIVHVAASDGAAVPARIYRPANTETGLRPAVLFCHGAGYLQNVHDGWSRYEREYAFHHQLAAEGYVVLDLDYRGSSGYGGDWRTAIHGHMGGRDLADFVDAARYLVAHERVDARRIGIYGGSYGGFMTLMALFCEPEVFAAGAALRPVTDWSHYNHGYTANILDTPLENPAAFERSSPIHHAAGLRGRLLICHGIVDDNVHAQDTIRLQQRLIELRKENWEVALYPVENHGFKDGASWADEYRRILKLFREL